MANDRFMQAWFNFSDGNYLEAPSVSQFNASGDFIASVLFKIPGAAFPQTDEPISAFLPSGGSAAMLWGNLDVVGADPFNIASTGWALFLGAPQNAGLEVLGMIGGMPVAASCLVAGIAPVDPLNTGHELADRLILASMHYYVVPNEVPIHVVDLYINGNRVQSIFGPDVPAYVASARAPRIGSSASLPNAYAQEIEIVGTSYFAIDPLFGPGLSLNMPSVMAEQFRAARQNNKLGLLSPSLDAAHTYNASGSQQDASGVKLLRVLTNPTVPVFSYNGTPRAVSAPDTGNQGAVALPGVTPAPLAVVGTLNVRTTQNPNWYTQVAPFFLDITPP
jgi:hypothetical protein